MIRQLFWKEWREQRWKIAFGCIVLMGFCAIGLQSRIFADRMTFGVAIIAGTFLMPLVMAMGVVGSERASGSLDYLLTLPIAPWRILAVKMAVGLCACWLPLLGALAVSLFMAGGREMAVSDMISVFPAFIWLASCLLMWITACSMGQPSETRAGLAGVGVILFYLLWTYTIGVSSYTNWFPRMILLLYDPMGSFVFNGQAIEGWPLGYWEFMVLHLIVQISMLAALWRFAVRRFARLVRTK